MTEWVPTSVYLTCPPNPLHDILQDEGGADGRDHLPLLVCEDPLGHERTHAVAVYVATEPVHEDRASSVAVVCDPQIGVGVRDDEH